MIKFDVKGKILEGKDSPNGEILLEDDTNGSTGGYYIYIWPKDGSCWPDSDKEMFYDSWFENYDRMIEHIKDHNWVIDWDTEMKQQTSVFAAVVTALLGNIPSHLRIVTFEEKDSLIIIRAFLDGEISENDKKSLDVVKDKLRSRFVDTHSIEMYALRYDSPLPLSAAHVLGTPVYQRKEPKTIAYSELSLLSFPDSQVLKININIENKLLSLSVDNAYLDRNSGINIDGGILTINDWEQFEAKIYSSEGVWSNDFDELKDIGEFTVSDEQIKLKGFGKRTGQWVEYAFSKACAHFTYSFFM